MAPSLVQMWLQSYTFKVFYEIRTLGFGFPAPVHVSAHTHKYIYMHILTVLLTVQ